MNLLNQYKTGGLTAVLAPAAVSALTNIAKSQWRMPLAALAALKLGRGYWRRRQSASMQPVAAALENVQTANVGGVKMRWEQHGQASSDAVPVVLVHGLPTHPRLWRYVVPQIVGRDTYALAWELVGFGWSSEEGLGRDISVARQAEYLHDWLEHLGIQKAVFVGHDLGGGVVQRLVASHPDLCAGLVLADCVAYDNWPVLAVKAAIRMSGLLAKLPHTLAKPAFQLAFATLGHDRSPRGAESAELHWKPYARSIGPKALAHQLDCLDPRDTLAVIHDLPKLDVPARVIWGAHDPLGLASGQQLAKDLGVDLRCIPGAGHFTPEDHPDVLATAIGDVLAEVKGLADSRQAAS